MFFMLTSSALFILHFPFGVGCNRASTKSSKFLIFLLGDNSICSCSVAFCILARKIWFSSYRGPIQKT